MYFVSYKVIEKFIFIYLWITVFLEKFIIQANKTTRLLINSFSEDTLYFFHDSLIPLISRNNNSYIIRPDLESACWSFNNNTFKFLSDNTNNNKKLPYIYACLYKNDTLVSDISDWVQKITINSSNDLPLRFLIFTWAYQNNIILESYLSSKYELQVITIDGDEMKLDIKTT